MITTETPERTLADLLHGLGDIPPDRVLLTPHPPTDDDVIRLASGLHKRLYEIVDGVLVEKAMGFKESALTSVLIRILGNFVDQHRLGLLTAPDGALRLRVDQVRIPDIALFSWARLPGGRLPDRPIPPLPADLAIEITSPSNTKAEMHRKQRDYLASGVRLVWIIDPRAQTVEVHNAIGSQVLSATGTLTGGEVLPGFTLDLATFFASLEPPTVANEGSA